MHAARKAQWAVVPASFRHSVAVVRLRERLCLKFARMTRDVVPRLQLPLSAIGRLRTSGRTTGSRTTGSRMKRSPTKKGPMTNLRLIGRMATISSSSQSGSALADIRNTVGKAALVGGQGALAIDEARSTYGAFP